MTYEMFVEEIRNRMQDANVDTFEESIHIAYQINIIGEGEGAFYIELNSQKVDVQPYEYYDRDVIFNTPGDVLLQVFDHNITMEEAIRENKVEFFGDNKIALQFDQLIPQVKVAQQMNEVETVTAAQVEAAPVEEKVKPAPKKRNRKSTAKKNSEASKDTESKEEKAPVKKAEGTKKQTKKK